MSQGHSRDLRTCVNHNEILRILDLTNEKMELLLRVLKYSNDTQVDVKIDVLEDLVVRRSAKEFLYIIF